MIILVVGLPGTGKTFFASRLADNMNAVHLNSDRIRSELGEWNQYSDTSKMNVYDAILKRMKDEVHSGKNVIVDTTFYKKEIRDKFFQASVQLHQPLRIIEVKASNETVRLRLSKPRTNSQADYEVYKKIKNEFEPLAEDRLVLFSDQQSLNEMVEKAVGYVKLK